MALQQAVQTGQAQTQTPEGLPTVAAQMAQRAQQVAQSQDPRMQGAAQNAGIAGGVQDLNARRVQGALQQMAQREAARQAPQGPLDLGGGVGGLPSGIKQMAEGGIVGFADGGLEDSGTQEEADRASMLEGLKKLAAAGYDVSTLIPRGLMGAFESGVTRPLRAMGVPIPYLPESAYGGDRSSITPMFDKVRNGIAAAPLGPRWGQEGQSRTETGALPVAFALSPNANIGELRKFAEETNDPVEKAAILAEIEKLTGGTRVGSGGSSGDRGGSAGGVDRSGLAALPAGMSAIPDPEEAAKAASVANAKITLPEVLTAEKARAANEQNRAAYGLSGLPGQSAADFIEQQKLANAAQEAKYQSDASRRPLDNLVNMLTAHGGPSLGAKLSAGARSTMALESAQRAEDLAQDKLRSERATALQAMQNAVDTMREARASGDTAGETAAKEAYRVAANAKNTAEAGIQEKLLQSRTQRSVARDSALAAIRGHELMKEAAEARADAAGGGSEAKMIAAQARVQAVLNQEPEYKKLKEMAGLGGATPEGRGRMKQIEEDVIRRIAPELVGAAPAAGGNKTVKWSDVP